MISTVTITTNNGREVIWHLPAGVCGITSRTHVCICSYEGTLITPFTSTWIHYCCGDAHIHALGVCTPSYRDVLHQFTLLDRSLFGSRRIPVKHRNRERCLVKYPPWRELVNFHLSAPTQRSSVSHSFVNPHFVFRGRVTGSPWASDFPRRFSTNPGTSSMPGSQKYL